jgi:hypothetical protein
MPDRNPFENPPRPDSETFWPTVSPTAKKVARFLNEVSGGDQFESGMIDVSPETIEHWASFLGSGLGKTAGRTYKLAESIVTGREFGLNDIPILRRFGGDDDGRFTTVRFTELADEIARTEKRMEAAGTARERLDIRRDNADVLRMAGQVKAAERRISQIRKQDKSDKEKSKLIDDIRAEVVGDWIGKE